jgi:dTDP-4-dehydrorhamnose reductase
MMRVLLLGGAGQLGCCLRDRWPRDWERHAPASAQLDIRDAAAVDKTMRQLRPDLVVNAAAYNRVDDAERSPAEARAVNAEGAGNVARAAARVGARLVHISTDYVFDGLQDGRPAVRPYSEEDVPHPLNVYGESKRQGELAVLAEAPGAIVLRTSWLFSEYGHNFARTILRLARAGRPLRVVSDQVGTPTYAGDLAWAVIRLGAARSKNGTPFRALHGVLHFSGAEAMSWFQFACRIVQGDVKGSVMVESIRSSDYVAAASRPPYSALSCDKMRALGVPPQPPGAGVARTRRRETMLQNPPF